MKRGVLKLILMMLLGCVVPCAYAAETDESIVYHLTDELEEAVIQAYGHKDFDKSACVVIYRGAPKIEESGNENRASDDRDNYNLMIYLTDSETYADRLPASNRYVSLRDSLVPVYFDNEGLLYLSLKDGIEYLKGDSDERYATRSVWYIIYDGALLYINTANGRHLKY